MEMQTVLLSNQRWKEVNPIQFGWEHCAPGHSFGPASRSYLLLHYVVSGKGVFTVGGRSYDLGPGQIFVIHPYDMTYYEADREAPWHYLWIGFEPVSYTHQRHRTEHQCQHQGDCQQTSLFHTLSSTSL